MTGQQVLDLPMGHNDAQAANIRDYLKCLLLELWNKGEGFSGKRPFGNSSWESELYLPLVKAGAIAGKLDEDGFLDECDDKIGDELIGLAIIAL